MRPPSPPDPLIGRTLGGKYVLEACLGMGGFGAVYRARQIPVNRAVAVKVALAADPLGSSRDRFLREATALAGLQNRAVAMLHDFGEEPDGLLYMVQEFVDGRDLAAVLREVGRLPPLRVVDLGVSVLEALIEAHGLGIVHRDIKPANIMLVPTRRGTEQVKLVDFGLAKAPMAGGRIASITGDDVIPGTPPFMAPEIWNQAPLTGAADQYALAVVLYRALAGRLPFDHPRLGGLMQQHLASPPPPSIPTCASPPARGRAAPRAGQGARRSLPRRGGHAHGAPAGAPRRDRPPRPRRQGGRGRPAGRAGSPHPRAAGPPRPADGTAAAARAPPSLAADRPDRGGALGGWRHGVVGPHPRSPPGADAPAGRRPALGVALP
ncbi:MAG: serine/threonine-protein kinase [bacterium]